MLLCRAGPQLTTVHNRSPSSCQTNGPTRRYPLDGVNNTSACKSEVFYTIANKFQAQDLVECCLKCRHRDGGFGFKSLDSRSRTRARDLVQLADA